MYKLTARRIVRSRIEEIAQKSGKMNVTTIVFETANHMSKRQ